MWAFLSIYKFWQKNGRTQTWYAIDKTSCLHPLKMYNLRPLYSIETISSQLSQQAKFSWNIPHHSMFKNYIQPLLKIEVQLLTALITFYCTFWTSRTVVNNIQNVLSSSLSIPSFSYSTFLQCLVFFLFPSYFRRVGVNKALLRPPPNKANLELYIA